MAQHLWSHPEVLCNFSLGWWCFLQNHLSGACPEKWRLYGHHVQFLRAGPVLQVTYMWGDFFRWLNRGVLGMMECRSLFSHQTRPVNASSSPCTDPVSLQAPFSLFPLGSAKGFADVCRELLWSIRGAVVLPSIFASRLRQLFPPLAVVAPQVVGFAF